MKDIFDQTIATYRDRAGAAAFVEKEKKFEAQRNQRVYADFERFDMRGWRVLDVGCGFGRDVAELRRRGAEAYGCDVSEPLLRQATFEVGPYFETYNMRDEKPLPFGGGFDLIWCCAVLVHIPRDELADVLRRMWNGLKPGGRLILVTKAGESQQTSLNLGESLPRIMVFYTVEEILAVLDSFGAVVEIRDGASSSTAFGESLLTVCVRKVD